jgi:hypothetical protein
MSRLFAIVVARQRLSLCYLEKSSTLVEGPKIRKGKYTIGCDAAPVGEGGSRLAGIGAAAGSAEAS